MKLVFVAILFCSALVNAGEPTLVDGHAISLHVRKWTAWWGTDSSTALVRNVSESPGEQRFDIFNMSSESADIQVVQVWPSQAPFSLHVQFAWNFICDLIRTSDLAKRNQVSGPCGAGAQLDNVSTIESVRSMQVWTPLRTSSIADSIQDKKGRMSSIYAYIFLTLEGADSVEVLIANWKTDKIVLAAPTTLEISPLLRLQNDCGSELKVVLTDIPVGIRKPPIQEYAGHHRLGHYNSTQGHSILFPWNDHETHVNGRFFR